jgi:hypothetical protein
MAYIAYEAVEENRDDANYGWAQMASGARTGQLYVLVGLRQGFQPRLRTPGLEPGRYRTRTQRNDPIVRSLSKEHTRETKLSSEKLFVEIKHMIWESIGLIIGKIINSNKFKRLVLTYEPDKQSSPAGFRPGHNQEKGSSALS